MKLTLTELIEIETLQEIQDGFSHFTGMAALTTDENGVPITEPSGFSDFCARLVRTTEKGGNRCQNCSRMGALRSRKAGKCLSYDCHAGLMDFAAPIMVNDKIIGCFVGGQVRVKDVDHAALRKTSGELGIDPGIFINAYKKTSHREKEEVERAAEILSLIASITSRIACQNFITIDDSHKKEELAIYQSDYFMRINEYMKQQLGVILEEARTSKESDDAKVLISAIDSVIDKSSNVLSVVDHMVEYLSLTGGNNSISEEKYSIHESLKPLQEMAYGMQGYELTFDIVFDDSVPKLLFGDSMRVSYVISRILDNRFTFTTSGWIILKIKARKEGYATMLVMEVSDTGTPFDEETKKHILRHATTGEVFDENTELVDDSGMEMVGLLLFQLSGRISFHSSETEGNTLIVEIPQLEVKEEGL